MQLTKRQRLIGIAAVLGGLVLYALVLDPLSGRADELQKQIDEAEDALRDNERLFTKRRLMSARWAEITSGGLRRDVSEAESQVLHSVRDWAQDAGLALSSLKPDRTERTRDFYTITIGATGTGSMGQFGRFLWHVQTAAIPVRISHLTIASRKEGTDDLSIQFGVSTICLAPEQGPPGRPGGGASLTTRSVAGAAGPAGREVMP